MKCTATGRKYTVFGCKGKQVWDNIHSADLIGCFYQFFRAPRSGEVYNIGGGRFSHASMLEAIAICQEIAGRELNWEYTDQNRTGDHMWWVSNNAKFAAHYPGWKQKYDVRAILTEIYEVNRDRPCAEVVA